MDVSIIIVNYNTINLLLNAIESIFFYTVDIKYEIIVVDNNSSDNSKTILYEKYGDKLIYISLNENIGFGRANNEGIKQATGRNIFFLNPDTKLINNSIKILSDYLDAHEDVAVCGGNLYDENMNPAMSYEMYFPSIISEINNYSGGIYGRIFYGKNQIHNFSESIKEVAYISGADLMIKSMVLNRVGVFNPQFFMYYEETELCFRVKKAHYKIINIPYAKIQHLEGKSFGIVKVNKKKIDMQNSSRNIFYDLCYSKPYKYLSNIVRNSFLLFRLFLSFLFNKQNYKYWYTWVEVAVLKK